MSKNSDNLIMIENFNFADALLPKETLNSQNYFETHFDEIKIPSDFLWISGINLNNYTYTDTANSTINFFSLQTCNMFIFLRNSIDLSLQFIAKFVYFNPQIPSKEVILTEVSFVPESFFVVFPIKKYIYAIVGQDSSDYFSTVFVYEFDEIERSARFINKVTILPPNPNLFQNPLNEYPFMRHYWTNELNVYQNIPSFLFSAMIILGFI